MSGLFFMLTLLTYKFYTEQTTWKRYVLVLLTFGLGLLAKPILMTLPFILFLLDLWPLKRIQVERREENGKTWGLRTLGVPIPRLILEKIPFLVLSFVSLANGLVGANKRMGLYNSQFIPVGLRISNAIVSPLKYLGKLFWPHGLAFFYPYPSMIPWWHVISAGLVLILITILALRAIFRYPYYLVGWLWFLGALVPFLGFFQAGLWPELADRYAYLTYIGIFIALSWGIPDLLIKWKYYRPSIIAAVSGIILILMVLTWNQASFWKNDETLTTHALKVTNNNFIAHHILGSYLLIKDDIDGAIMHLQEAIRIKAQPIDYFSLGYALVKHQEPQKAIAYYLKGLMIDPFNAKGHIGLGIAMVEIGKTDEAVKHFNEGLDIDPNDYIAHIEFGKLLEEMGKTDEAVKHFNEAVKINPKNEIIAYVRLLEKNLAEKGGDIEAVKPFNKP